MQKGSKPKWCLNKPKPEYKVDKDELKKRLTPIQYRVTQEKATERPFSGQYLKLKDNGMYACIVCGEELFSSSTKYDSSCGWPAFYDCIDSKKVRFSPDLSHVGSNLLLLAIKPDLVRTEVTCSKCGAHLGHLFDDGPKPTGKRYCINSAALKFKEQKSNSVDTGETELKDCLSSSTMSLPSSPESLLATCDNPVKNSFVRQEKECIHKPSVESEIDRKISGNSATSSETNGLIGIKSQSVNPAKALPVSLMHSMLETHL